LFGTCAQAFQSEYNPFFPKKQGRTTFFSSFYKKKLIRFFHSARKGAENIF